MFVNKLIIIISLFIPKPYRAIESRVQNNNREISRMFQVTNQMLNSFTTKVKIQFFTQRQIDKQARKCNLIYLLHLKSVFCLILNN